MAELALAATNGLDDAIGAGEGAVEVEYTGALSAQVTLDIERWTNGARTAQSLSATAPATARRGSLVNVRVRATRPSDSQSSEVWLSLPPFARLEAEALDRLVTNRAIAAWSERNGLLVLSFTQDAATLDAAVALRVARPGRYSFAAVELRDSSGRRGGITGPIVTVE